MIFLELTATGPALKSQLLIVRFRYCVL